MNMAMFTHKDERPRPEETFEYKSLQINKYPEKGGYHWQATAKAITHIVPYGYGATAEEAVRKMLDLIDESIKNLNLLRQDALEALDEECKNKQEVQNG